MSSSKIAKTVALVTGAAQGLGLATATHLAQSGAKVALLDLNINNIAPSIDPMRTSIGQETNMLKFKCDVTDEKQVKDVLGKVVDAYGYLNAVVNCAGVVYAMKVRM